MFKIVNKLIVSKDVKRLNISAPEVARCCLPGQFVMVQAHEHSAAIPLAIVEADSGKGLITLIFQEQGKATRELGELPIHGDIYWVMGPLGTPASIDHYGTVLCVATDVGTAPLVAICRALKKEGNRVVGVMGGKTRKEILLESQWRVACHKVIIATEDGSFDRKGKVSKVVGDIMKKEDIHRIYAIGPTEMLEELAGLTSQQGVPLRVFIYTPMACGVGICGSCRTEVGHKIVLPCEHGPEFDGQMVNYQQLKIQRKNLEVAQKLGAERVTPRSESGLSGFWAKLIGTPDDQ